MVRDNSDRAEGTAFLLLRAHGQQVLSLTNRSGSHRPRYQDWELELEESPPDDLLKREFVMRFRSSQLLIVAWPNIVEARLLILSRKRIDGP